MAEIPISSDLMIGTGLDSATGISHRVAIEFNPPLPNNLGQDVSTELVSIKSSRELTKTLNISASASFSTFSGGASAEYSLSRSSEFNEYFTYALIRVKVRNSPSLLTKPNLSLEAREYVTQNGWEEFFNLYGDRFVEGIITGGSYYALIQIQTSNRKEQEEATLKLSGYYGAFKASASFKETFEEIQKKTVTNIFLRQRGGLNDQIELTLDEMLKQVRDFPNLIRDNPVNIVAITADYRDKVRFPDMPAPNSLPRIQQRKVLEDLGKEYLKLRDYKANIQFVLEHFSEFDDFRELETEELNANNQKYKNSLESVLNEIDEIIERAENCQNDYGQCSTYAPDINFLSLPTIGGEQLSIKQMEEQIAALRQQVENLTSGLQNVQHNTKHIYVDKYNNTNIDAGRNIFRVSESGDLQVITEDRKMYWRTHSYTAKPYSPPQKRDI